MASKILGQKEINELRALNTKIKNIYNGDMFQETNNLHSFVNQLIEWGNNTPIGTDIKDKLTKTINELIRLVNHTQELYKYMEDFLNSQEEINQGIY